MSLAAITIATSDFDWIFEHLTTNKPRHRNMHMRETRQQNRKEVLRYLHAMYALKSSVRRIEGMISGPRVFAHYSITRRSAQYAQINDLDTSGDPKEFARLHKQFVKEILDRVKQEKSNKQFASNGLPGRYYLRRQVGGMLASDPICRQAVSSKEQAFVDQLQPWDLRLVYRQ